MSWSRENRLISSFHNHPLQINAPENENSPNWDRYRLSLERMRSLQVHSTHWRVTCSYPTHAINFTDYLRGNFKDFNIFDFPGGVRRVREWNTSTSEATQARIWRRLSGRSSIYPLCISTVACSRRLDSGEQVKSYAARAKRNTGGEKNEGRLGLRDHEDERNNFFSEILLVGQKYRE